MAALIKPIVIAAGTLLPCNARVAVIESNGYGVSE
jgi:hypothetical protein